MQFSKEVQIANEYMKYILSRRGNVNQSIIEIPSHPSQNGYHQENKKQQMVVRVQGDKETLIRHFWECKPTMEISIEVTQNTKNRTIVWSCYTILKEYKSVYNRDTCTLKLTAELFTIIKLWSQHRCPSTDEWRKKLWYIYTVEYYLAIKMNEIMSFARKWMELEIIMLSK
jgi:hypothetical protein